ncbi:P-loop containing nucleoside triphosphate hydrolase protein [Mycena galericulata]|nr:P-loop containing nucleoside triphosphate hydrolase protein [Mycena galericulata]
MGSVHTDVGRKLCAAMVRVLKDISIDILPSEEFPRSEAPFDYEGVDLLAEAILVGISSWFTEINPTQWALQPWYVYLREVVYLLRGPISAALLPNSFSRATSNSFEKDIPTIYREVELDVRVETSTKTVPPPISGSGSYYSEPNSGMSSEDAKHTRKFIIAVLGLDGTGKTALTYRFINNEFIEQWDPTIEDLYHRQILVAGEVSLLEIIDTSGAKEYEVLHERYMKVPIVVVGLKSDLSYKREVDAATIESLSSQLNIPFYEASAKLSWHVDDVFEDLIRQLRLKYPPDTVTKSEPVIRPDSVMKRGKQHQKPCIIM